MKPNKIIAFLIFFALSGNKSPAQTAYPLDYFSAPVDIPIVLSGSFAELRSNHSHSGIDIRTQGVEGKNILACADGYVSRIRISPFGFGKTLYVTHPNGYSTVYAHLSGFRTDIASWARSEQYRLEQFEVDLFPAPGLLKVTRSEIIAFSGNSGSSQGPHLHFEIRESATEMPVNPLLFGMPVRDFTRPVINAVRIYPEGQTSTVAGRKTDFDPKIAGWGTSYRLVDNNEIEAAGAVSFGINAHDLQSGGTNKNGINLFRVLVDSLPFFEWKAEKFSFAETRYINSFIDYAFYNKAKERFIRTKKAPNNKLSLYKTIKNDGILEITAGKSYTITIETADGHGNLSSVGFKIKGVSAPWPSGLPLGNLPVFSHDRLNEFSSNDLRISLPGKCLYDTLHFEYSTSPALPEHCASVHSIHKPDVPLHDYFDLSIRIGDAWLGYEKKLIMVKLGNTGKPESAGGTVEGEFLRARVREFGRYTVMADTVSPVIKAINIRNNQKQEPGKAVVLSISDDLSGIKNYRGTMNGRWILMDYDPKNKRLTYTPDDRMNTGSNAFVLYVEDGAGNASEYKATLMR